MKKGLKILFIGNSFSVDTMQHVPEIAKDLGFSEFKFCNLYIGGCSIRRHYDNVINNTPGYVRYTSTGEGWEREEGYSIERAVREEEWDVIAIQHGTGDKSKYTLPQSYENLPSLIRSVLEYASGTPKVVFNMAWVAEPESKHHEITSYGGDQKLMYEKLTALTRDVVAALSEVNLVSPAGTAIQNARVKMEKKLTRDSFHLSYDLGRYIAGLTFFCIVTGSSPEEIRWYPEGVSEEERGIVAKAASLAILHPYHVTMV